MLNLRSLRTKSVFAKNQQAVITTLRTVGRTRDAAAAAGMQAIVEMCNVQQSVLLLNFDVSVVLQDLANAKSIERQRVYARTLALLALTYFDNVGPLLGKPWRDLLSSIDLDQTTREHLSRLHKALHQLHRKHAGMLRPIRNATIAHRDRNASTQIRIIDSIKPLDAVTLGADLMQWSTDFYTAVVRMNGPVQDAMAHHVLRGRAG